MSLERGEVEKIAHLARLKLRDEEVSAYTAQLSNILQFVQQMNGVDTAGVAALAHPLDLTARWRSDQVTEPDRREEYQQIAPQVEAGLYLVPKVIE